MKRYLGPDGATFEARTVSDLRKAVGGGKIYKLYRDKLTWSGRETSHIGYEIGGRSYVFQDGEKS